MRKEGFGSTTRGRSFDSRGCWMLMAAPWGVLFSGTVALVIVLPVFQLVCGLERLVWR